MFNLILSTPYLFLLTLFSFFIIFTIRQLFIRKKILYHVSLFFILFIAAIAGGSVQNDGYYRLEKFILLEKNNQLQEAKKNPHNYDSMLQIDLEQFANSNEFKDYLKQHDSFVDNAEAVFIGWLFAVLAEISMLFAQMLSYRSNLKKQDPSGS